ncbi:MAG: bifunctional 3-deoxy-7-phosphoheptulonate synthase/chorismate mutase [Ignavibacteriales bacterium]|nr:bifunctional 3-deoxy-7-phosphoheptulonate synthase/chorismate mutase [Ignavibacteriales bacterium]
MKRAKKISFEKIREEINSVDNKILELLSQRRNLSEEVVKIKEVSDKPIRDEKREEDLLIKLIRTGKKLGLSSHFITKIYQEIIEDSVKLQQKHLQKIQGGKAGKNKPLVVAIQGIEGSYSYLASQKYFSNYFGKIQFVKNDTFEDVVNTVEKGAAEFAVLPIENTTSGGINEVYDLLLHTSLSIIGEETFPVNHCLVAIKDNSIDSIEKIYAHYQAATQCSKFISTLKNCKVEYFSDTALSVRKIIEEKNPKYAALASKEAALLFKVRILAEGVANQSGNYTRFLIATRKPIQVDSRIPAKTSIVMATSHSPGALVNALSVFQQRKINLTKLESRPILGNPWEEMFYLDFEGNINDKNIEEAINELGPYTRFFKVLGCYPMEGFKKVKLPFDKIIEQNEKEKSKTLKVEKEEKIIIPKNYKLASRAYQKEDTIIKLKDVTIGGSNFVVIAGPCSVESNEQIIACASHAKEFGADVLRGGCFKPRSSPYSFQGLGFDGLEILENAGNQNGMPVITEVLQINQIEAVLKHADILQIGARNMQNFSLLKEIGKTHKPIMLKRGMMSSIEELLMAAEYILSQGNRQVILCERGIRTFETATRNTLDLSAVLVLKEKTHLPIIVDPSHAVGQRNKVIPLAKAAKIVGAHGVMVEFHPEPDKAFSDGEQSLTFGQFEEMMRELRNI